MRKRLFEIIEGCQDKDTLSKFYDMLIFTTIIISIVPLMYKDSNYIFRIFDMFAVEVFIINYILEFLTADFKFGKGIKSFLIYPFTLYAIIDLLSIFPYITPMNSSFKLLRILRVFKTLRLFKELKFSEDFVLIVKVIQKRSEILAAVFLFAIGYIILSALIMFNVEPSTFKSFFDAVYWATTSLTTIGYGDIYPVSDVGKAVSMVSAIFGIAMIALPSGIISASFMDEIRVNKKE